MSPEARANHPRRWWILAVIGLAQLMVVLDATIVNIALPSAQADLGFRDDSRQWVITAYALAFGSLLLLGGRIGDIFGRKRVFIAGLIGFAVASAIAGAAEQLRRASSPPARSREPSARCSPRRRSRCSRRRSPSPDERGKAFGVFGAIAGAGAAVGLLLGGVLTEYLYWRWMHVRQPLLRDPGDPRLRSRCCIRPLATARPRSTSPARSPRPAGCSRSSTASRAPRPTAGATR